jgi:hypothetical protein
MNQKLYVLAAAVVITLGLLFTGILPTEDAWSALRAIFVEAIETTAEGTAE